MSASEASEAELFRLHSEVRRLRARVDRYRVALYALLVIASLATSTLYLHYKDRGKPPQPWWEHQLTILLYAGWAAFILGAALTICMTIYETLRH